LETFLPRFQIVVMRHMIAGGVERCTAAMNRYDVP